MSTLRLPGLKAWACSGLTLSGASLPRVLNGGAWCRRMGQDNSKITGPRVSQLKKYLCYDNFSFDKRSFSKDFWNKAAGFGLIFFSSY
jgi:hypothetical protein